ncbi:MAG: hypothetical protein IT560_06255 [Alphaproteobacteria bacterium]|nr:hypothetical protein [Alphaproteobacteria bacterium]
MSISEFFNRKSRAVIAAVTLALGAGGGYIGHETAQQTTQPQVSEFTLQQLPDNMTEKQFVSGKLPVNATYDALQPARVDEFTARIDAMAQLKSQMRFMASDLYIESEAKLRDDAVSFVNDLRVAENLSERNYADLVKDYNARVGLDVSAVTGNYTKGIMYQQDAQLGVMFGMIFGDDDMTPAQISREVGDAMLEGQKMADNAGLAGGAAGLLLGGLLTVPLWRRRNYPKVGK